MKVFIIDDNEEFRKRYRTMLEKEGLDVLEAPDALEVTNLLMRESNEMDLILLDLQIADVDGRDIYKIIRDYTTSIPIIVTSVLPLKDQKLKIPHARDYFNKADGDANLLAKIKMIFGLD